MRSYWLLALLGGSFFTSLLADLERAFAQEVSLSRSEQLALEAARTVPGFDTRPELPFAVEKRTDLAYRNGDGSDAQRHKLDLYLPKGAKDFPVLFFVHGGSWRSGNKDLYNRIGELYAGNGIGTVIINYRLSPKVKHPAHIQDVAAAFAWTYRNIEKYGGRADRIFASGHSAGGHLVSLLVADPSYLKAEGLTPEVVRGVIPMSGVYTPLPLGMMTAVFGEDPEARKKAFPLTHLMTGVTRKLPPFLVLYADRDFPFIDTMSVTLHKALRTLNAESVQMAIANRNHITIILGVMVQTDPASQAILKFIREHAELPKPAESRE